MLMKDRKPNNMREQLKPIIDDSQVQNGVWLQLIPGKLKMAIYEPGVGSTPCVGDFLRVQQIVYLQDMTPVTQDRITYIYGRDKLIQGLDLCLSMAKEYFKARIFISSQLAYQHKRQPGIPHNSNLVIDLEVTSVTKQPINAGQMEDEALIGQIMKEAEQGDNAMAQGKIQKSLKSFESAYQKIQSNRFREIRSYLFNKSKLKLVMETQKERNYENEKDQLAKIHKIMDLIKIKTIEVALLNNQFYKVIKISYQCLQEPRLESNLRIIFARARAYSQIGQFDLSIGELEKIKQRFPQDKKIEAELERSKTRKKQLGSGQCVCPILTIKEDAFISNCKIQPKNIPLPIKKLNNQDNNLNQKYFFEDQIGIRGMGGRYDHYGFD